MPRHASIAPREVPSRRFAVCGVAAFAAAALLASGARAQAQAPAGPDPAGAASDVGRIAPRALGNAIGGLGLVSAAALASAGDLVHLIDANRFTRPVARGAVSQTIRGAAWLISNAGTSALEALRGEPIERWPEPSAAYLEADPGLGRIDTIASGIGALWLVPRDAASGLLSGLLRGVGARTTAQRVRADARRAALQILGPPAGPIPITAEADRGLDAGPVIAPSR